MSKKSKRISLIKGSKSNGSIRVSSDRHSKSSKEWLDRQLNDPFVKQAKKDGYRSRAAYKLAEIDELFKIFKPNMKVVDLGAAPGSWCQYAKEKIVKGKLVGIDLLPIVEIDGCDLLKGDFTEDDVLEQLEEMFEGKLDVVMSDMAPNASGHSKTDNVRMTYLLELALDFAINHLKINGTFIAKVFRAGAEINLLNEARKHFEKVRHFKPQASRDDSSEIYLIATGFKG